MFKFKKLLSMVLIAVTVLLSSSTAFAQTEITSNTVTYNGITYQIHEGIDENGNKEVIVIGDGVKTTVVNDDNVLLVTEETKLGITETSHILNYDDSSNDNITIQSTGSLSTPFWNYHYYWNDDSYSLYGMFYGLDSGDTYGSWYNYTKNATAISGAEGFMDDVRDIYNQQWGAIGSLGFAAASAIAGALSAPSGVGAVVGIVLAAGGTIGSAGFWVAAYTSSLSANYNFTLFKNNYYIH
jgi:hypothetical protein